MPKYLFAVPALVALLLVCRPVDATTLGLEVASTNVKTGDTVSFKVTVDGIAPTPAQLATISIKKVDDPTPTDVAATFSIPATVQLVAGAAVSSATAESYGVGVFEASDSDTSVTSSPTITISVVPDVQLSLPETSIAIGGRTAASFTVDGRPATPEQQGKAVYASTAATIASIDDAGEITGVTSGAVSLTVTFSPAGLQAVTSKPVVLTVAPTLTGVGQLPCSIYPIDYSTSNTAFGYEIAKNYHVMKLTIQNRDDQHRTIIVYGDSLTAQVSIETQPDSKRGPWAPVTEQQFSQWFESAEKPLQVVDLASQQVGAMTYLTLNKDETRPLGVVNIPKDKNTTPVSWTSDPPSVVEVDASTGFVKAKSPGYATVTAQSGSVALATWVVYVPDPNDTSPHMFGWQPLGSKLILDSAFIRFDRAREKSWPNVLAAVGNLGSFLITARGVSNGALPFFNAYNGLLIPALDKFFPSHRDAEQTNLHNDLMQPIEQIAYGDTLTRYLVFPSGDFSGLVANKTTRIGTIYPDVASVSIAYVSDPTNVASPPKPQ